MISVLALLAAMTGVTDVTPARAGARHIPVYVDDAFTVADGNKIYEAVASWNKSLLGYEHLDIVTFHSRISMQDIEDVEAHHGIMLMQVGSDTTIRPPAGNEPGAKPPIAWADSIGGNFVWFVRPEIADDMFEVVVEHEIGHLLGANHQRGFANTMYPYTDPNMMVHCLDRATAAEVARVQGVPSVAWTCR